MDGGGEDLAARGGGAVGQHFDLAVVVGVVVGRPAARLDLAAFQRGDDAAGQQRVGRGDGLVDVAAGVAAHVDDQLARPALAHVLERGAELLRRPLLEERHLDVGDALVLLRRQRHRVERRRLDGELVALGLAAAQHLHVHRVIGAQRVAHLPDRHPGRRLSVDLLDEVAALDARLRRRRARHRRDHVAVAEALRHHEADAVVVDVGEVAVRRHLRGRDVVAELVDRVGDAVEGAVEQLVRGNRLDIVVPNQVEDLGEDAEVAVGRVFLRGLAEQRTADQQQHQGHGKREEGDFLFAHSVAQLGAQRSHFRGSSGRLS